MQGVLQKLLQKDGKIGMNVLYTGVYFISLLSLIIVMRGIFGFSFSTRTRDLICGAVLVLTGAIVTLLLSDPSDRIFVSLFVQIIVSAICFEGKRSVLAEVSFLVHFTIMIVEALVQSIIVMIWYVGTEISGEHEVVLDVVYQAGTCFLISIFSMIVSRYTPKVLQRYLKQFNWRHVLYYLLWIFSSGIVIGFASGMAMDNGMIYRYKVTMQLAICVLSIGILSFGVLLNVLYEQRKKLKEDDRFKQMCIEQQTAQYEEMTVKNRKLQHFRHDQKAYLLALRALIEQGDLTQLRQYTEDIERKVGESDYIATGNMVADAILNERAAWADGAEVEFFTAGRFPGKLQISDSDLAVLLSNAVKNACEAAIRCREKREVFVFIKSYKKALFLEIKNSADVAPVMRDGHLLTNKTDRVNHGIGTQNMKQVVEKYNGTLSWEYDGECYVTTKIEI